jgi:Type IV secretory pathway, VirD4 components
MLGKEYIKSEVILKVIRFSITTIIVVLTMPIASYFIHQTFLQVAQINLLNMKYDWNYINAVRAVIQIESCRIFYIMLIAAYVLIIVCMLLRPRAELANIKQRKITNNISIPVEAGSGQHGKERFTTKGEQKKLFTEYLYTGINGKLPTSCGLIVGLEKTTHGDIIKYVKETYHTLTIGMTGIGKSRRIMMQTIALQILAKHSSITADVKPELFYYTSGLAKKMGNKVIALDFQNPKKSARYNYLQDIIDAIDEGDTPLAIDYTWDLVSALVGEKKGEPLWYNGETATIASIILAVCLEAPDDCKNLTNVYYFLAYMCEVVPEIGKSPIQLFLASLEDNHPAKAVYQMANIAPNKTKGSFFTSALGTLRLFTNPNIAAMTAKSDFRTKDIGREATTLYLMVPDEKQTLYPLVSIFIQQAYVKAVELAKENGGILPVPLEFDIDEAGNFPTIPVLAAMHTAGRSRGVRVNTFWQSYQQIESKYEDDFATIKSNCAVKVYLRTDDTDTLKEISERLGTFTVETSTAGSSVGNNSINDINVSNSGSITSRELLKPSELARIEEPYAMCMLTGQLSSIITLPDISQYMLNKDLGMGDRLHNQNLIMKVEAERKELDNEEIPLWGIWNVYKTIIQAMIEEQEKSKKNKEKGNEERKSILHGDI